MKVLLIGATGTIGGCIANELERDCEVIYVGGTSGDYQVDIADSAAIAAMYRTFADVDAVVCAAARGVIFKPLDQITMDEYRQSLQSKQLGQVELVVQGLRLLGDHVSYTLTTGLLNCDPIKSGSAAAMVNGAVEGFVRAAAIDMPAKQRVNVVSPGLLLESVEKYRDFFPGFQPVPGAVVALAYRKAVMGHMTGEVIKVGW